MSGWADYRERSRSSLRWRSFRSRDRKSACRRIRGDSHGFSWLWECQQAGIWSKPTQQSQFEQHSQPTAGRLKFHVTAPASPSQGKSLQRLSCSLAKTVLWRISINAVCLVCVSYSAWQHLQSKFDCQVIMSKVAMTNRCCRPILYTSAPETKLWLEAWMPTMLPRSVSLTSAVPIKPKKCFRKWLWAFLHDLQSCFISGGWIPEVYALSLRSVIAKQLTLLCSCSFPRILGGWMLILSNRVYESWMSQNKQNTCSLSKEGNSLMQDQHVNLLWFTILQDGSFLLITSHDLELATVPYNWTNSQLLSLHAAPF